MNKEYEEYWENKLMENRELLLQEDKNFEAIAIEKGFDKSNLVIRYFDCRNELLNRRTKERENELNFIDMSKENLERIFLQVLNDSDVNYIENAVKKLNWTVEKLYSVVKKTGCTVLQEAGCPCYC